MKSLAKVNTLSKILILAAALTASLLTSSQATYSAEKTQTPNVRIAFLDELHRYVLGCAVQPYNFDSEGNKVLGNLKSICPELKSFGSIANFVLENEVYTAFLYDSKYSDGGDLNDLIIRNQKGAVVAWETHVPAFGDILLALAGGDDQFPHVYEESSAESN